MTNAWTRALVQAAMDDDQWADLVEDCDPVLLASELKRIISDIGRQEQMRNAGLALARTEASAEDYETARRGFLAWRRSIARVVPKLRERANQIRPAAQQIHDRAQLDRRNLVILAKRIWLWEEGLEDRLEYALDECHISEATSPDGKKTLRQLIDELRADGTVLRP